MIRLWFMTLFQHLVQLPLTWKDLFILHLLVQIYLKPLRDDGRASRAFLPHPRFCCMHWLFPPSLTLSGFLALRLRSFLPGFIAVGGYYQMREKYLNSIPNLTSIGVNFSQECLPWPRNDSFVMLKVGWTGERLRGWNDFHWNNFLLTLLSAS